MKTFLENKTISGKWGKALFLGAFLFSSCGGGSATSSSEETEAKSTYSFEEDVSNDQGLSYEIFVPAYADSDKDGVGDFNGIAQKADYLASLGVNRVWLMPIHPAMSYHGYDVTDYYDVNSNYGTMDDFEEMVKTLKSKGIEVILDMVLNHSGSRNPWFQQAYDDYMNGEEGSSSKADWYSFSEESKGNGWNKKGYLYYECNFSSTMPEFNFDSESFRNEVKSILNFWLDKGVGGFRLDAVMYYYYNEHSRNAEVCDFLREAVSEKYPNCYFVGETWTDNSTVLSKYFPSGLDSFFDFGDSVDGENTFVKLAKGNGNGSDIASSLASYVNKVKAAKATSVPSFFMSNHDQDRPCNSLYKEEWQKMAASVLYLMPGTPYIYYGEEINLFGIRGEEQTDGMRRLPMVWKAENDEYRCNVPDSSVTSLYSKVELPEKGASEQAEIAMSTVNHYQKVGNVRNRLKGIVNATMEATAQDDGYIMAYRLKADKNYIIIHNCGKEKKSATLPSSNVTLFDSIDTQGIAPKVSGTSVTLEPYSSAIFLEQ